MANINLSDFANILNFKRIKMVIEDEETCFEVEESQTSLLSNSLEETEIQVTHTFNEVDKAEIKNRLEEDVLESANALNDCQLVPLNERTKVYSFSLNPKKSK